MSRWSAFLTSLRTGGGRVFVAMMCLFVFGGMGATFVYFPPATDDKVAASAATALVGLIGMFAGVLAAALRGDRNNGNESGNATGFPARAGSD